MRVTGYIDGVLYTVETDPTITPDPYRGIVVSQSDAVLAHLAPLVGYDVAITPVGPDVLGTLDNDRSIYAMLLASTEVVAAVDEPVLVEPSTELMEH